MDTVTVFADAVFPFAGCTLIPLAGTPLSSNCVAAPVAEIVSVCGVGAGALLLTTQNVMGSGLAVIEALWACAVSRKHNWPTKTVMSQVMNLKRFGTESLQLRGGILVLLEQSWHHLGNVSGVTRSGALRRARCASPSGPDTALQ